jgi:hypothetical protein
LKFIVLATALLLPGIALAQDAAPPALPAPAAVAPKPAVRAARPAPKPVAKPAADRLDGLNVVQIIGVRQVDAATFEIDARLADGNEVNLRMNAFVMQDLGRQLGTFGK